MRILIIKPSSLGDVVHALPTVNLIRRRHPDARIAWLINHELSGLLERCPIIDERIEFARRAYGSLPSLLARLRRGRFDLVVDLQGLLRSGLFARVTGAPQRIGLSDSREGARWFHTEVVTVPRCHAVDRYLKAADHLGCGTAPVVFPIGHADSLPIEGTGWIAVNPMARWESKIWPADRFAALLEQLPAERLVFVGSRGEADRIEAITRGRAWNLAGRLTLLQLAAFYRRCAVVISNDTGPMHIAAAVGARVVALFGPTDPRLVGPYGAGHVVLQGAGGRMDAITVEQVAAAVKPFLA